MKHKDISYKRAGKFEESRYEKIHNVVFDNSIIASIAVAEEISNLIKSKQKTNEKCIIGLATGSSPIAVYNELIRLHNEEKLSFHNVITCNLDEYLPMHKKDIQSYYFFMHEHLFNHIDILPENIHIPDGTVSNDGLYQYCVDYELKIRDSGGLDYGIKHTESSGRL